jgi:hypothetical protein
MKKGVLLLALLLCLAGCSGGEKQSEAPDAALLAEGFVPAESEAPREYTVDEIIASLMQGGDMDGDTSAADWTPSAYDLTWLDTSDYDDTAGLEGYVNPGAQEVIFDDTYLPEQSGLIVMDWKSELSEEELGLIEGTDGDPLQSELFALLPALPGTPDAPMEADGALMLSVSGITQAQAAEYFEACKAAGFDQYTEEADMTSYGMGFMWTAYDANGNALTLMLSNDTLQIIIESA